MDGNETSTASEGLFADGLYCTGDTDSGKTSTASKGPFADGRNKGWNGYGNKTGAVLEGRKVRSPMDVTCEGIWMVVSPEQPMKAQLPMDIAVQGIWKVVRPVQSRKAPSPMETTEDGIRMVVSPEQL